MSLSDLFDRTARLSGKVFVRGLIIGVVTMLPAGVVMGFAMREIFAAIADTMHRTANMPDVGINAIVPMFYGITEFGIAILLYSLGSTILQTSIIDLTDAEMHAAPRTWQGAFARGWHAAFTVLGQYIVILFVLSSMIGFSIVLGAGVLQHWAAIVLLFGAAGIGAMWLIISWAFGPQAVMCERYGPVEGLSRSRLLVRGSWWRVFGILLLFGILVQFAVMIVTVPLQGIAFASFMPELIDLQKRMLTDTNDPSALEPFLMKLSTFGWQIGLLQAVSGTLVGIVQGVYSTLVYYDLRARSGEFDGEEGDYH